MALINSMTKTLEIPHEPGQTMTLRMLSWRQLSEAREKRSAKVLKGLRDMGGELLRELQSADRKEIAEAAADPLNDYDQATLLHTGITAWSYETPVSAESIDQLDEQTAEWAAREIVGLHQRSETAPNA